MQKRILLTGDSHIRGCASELGKYLGPNYQVSGIFMPGWRLQNITKLAKNEIAGFSKQDIVIIWGGSNYVNRNESNEGPKEFEQISRPKNQYKYHDSNNPTKT